MTPEQARERAREWVAGHADHECGALIGTPCPICDPDVTRLMARFLSIADEARQEERKRCADIADNTLRACITDEERDIATTIRNLILAPVALAAAQPEEESK